MGWSTSNLSGAAVDALMVNVAGATQFYGGGNGGTSWTADAQKAALYGTTPTPNKNDTLANNTYLAGQWVTGNETTGTGYTAGGTALASLAHSFGSGTQQLTAGNPAWTSATLAAVFGCLVYDSTLTTKYAYCWNYFGGSQSVTAGTFTIVWSGSGILQFTIT
jgi:hypothetical protein